MDMFSLSHQINSSVSSNISHEAFRQVFSTFTMLLVDMNLPLNLKVKAQSVQWITSHYTFFFLLELLIKVKKAI